MYSIAIKNENRKTAIENNNCVFAICNSDKAKVDRQWEKYDFLKENDTVSYIKKSNKIDLLHNELASRECNAKYSFAKTAFSVFSFEQHVIYN